MDNYSLGGNCQNTKAHGEKLPTKYLEFLEYSFGKGVPTEHEIWILSQLERKQQDLPFSSWLTFLVVPYWTILGHAQSIDATNPQIIRMHFLLF